MPKFSGLLSYGAVCCVFIDDLQMLNKPADKTGASLPANIMSQGLRRQVYSSGPRRSFRKGSAAKLTYLARELSVCFCVRIENFSNARACSKQH